jgi:hypothetical protein
MVVRARVQHAVGHNCQQARATSRRSAEFAGSWKGNAESIPMSFHLRNHPLAGTSHAGGGTRTPDTRIMIPRRFGSAEPKIWAGGHERGHIRAKGAHGRPLPLLAALRQRADDRRGRSHLVRGGRCDAVAETPARARSRRGSSAPRRRARCHCARTVARELDEPRDVATRPWVRVSRGAGRQGGSGFRRRRGPATTR